MAQSTPPAMNKPARTTVLKAWVVCMVASLFFLYEFIQMNMFNAVSTDLMHAFHINATGVSRLSAFYFIANVIFLFVAGSVLDRFSTKKVILTALGICILGTTFFAVTKTIGWATFFRFLTGIGSAFCFLSVIRLATRWFEAARLALVIGFVVMVAMLGGVLAQKPLSLLVTALGWREALLVDAGIGGVIFILILQFVYDFPDEFLSTHQRELKYISDIGYWQTFKLAFFKIQNWLGGIFVCLLNLPVIILGGLWGTEYLVKMQGIPKTDAPYITQMLFFGMIIGSPLIGWISDQIRLRRLPMMVGGIFSLVLTLLLAVGLHFSFWLLLTFFFILGFSSSAQVLGYPIVAENSIPAITAMSVSVVNISAQGGLAVFEPLFGYLMDLHHHAFKNALVYVGSDFTWAMWVFPCGIMIALIALKGLKETHANRSGCGH